jgi:hypothetical protein
MLGSEVTSQYIIRYHFGSINTEEFRIYLDNNIKAFQVSGGAIVLFGLIFNFYSKNNK